MRKHYLFFFLITLSLLSCDRKDEELFIPQNIVIAHRGSTYFTPEETESAYRWARNIGSDYLEVDIQRTKDDVLLALHDHNLTRTTNVEAVFFSRKDMPASSFTFEEIMQLDAGSWFNELYPNRAMMEFSQEAPLYLADKNAFSINTEGKRIVYNGPIDSVCFGGKLGVLTLEDVVRIAEGYRIAKDALGNRLYEKYEEDGISLYRFFYVLDNDDSGDRPGIYIETKVPELFPNIEKDLFIALDRLNWNVVTKPINDTIIFEKGKVRIGKTSAKVILQTFSVTSLKKLYNEFKGQVPTCFLVWLGDPNFPFNDSVTYFENLRLAKDNGAQIIGPSIQGTPNNYADLLTEPNYNWIKSFGFHIHPYTFNTDKQASEYGEKCDGMFTNRADLTIKYYKTKGLR
ncbi:MAG: hypothetical protein KAH25_08720 [Bacteroidales bacterium]|nr:hypothetical protein [Bacteroidales bacterium]